MLLLTLVIGLITVTKIADSAAIPVDKSAHKEEEEESTLTGDQADAWANHIEYSRYLREIVEALESDSDFRKKLEGAEVADIKSGKIARELHFVDHGIRTRLDELKRSELERLRHLAVQEHEKKNGVDRSRMKIPTHIDHKNPTRFEVEDLRKLIVQTTKELEEADVKRRDEFKKYEMEKEYEFNESLKILDDEHKVEEQKKHDEEKKKHKDHAKLHHPGSKQQLEEVWEETDHMSKDDFDPKVFFKLHDLDNNGYWDQIEVNTLFKKELDKMYDPNAPEDDMNERYEEMERMREHVFQETDKNKDGLISYEEFLEQAQKNDFEKDEGWEGLDEQDVYSQQEFEAYERQRQEELNNLIREGKIPPPPNYHAPPPPHPGMAVVPGQQLPPHAIPQGYQQVPPQGYQQVRQEGYQQVPPQGYQQVPPQGYQHVPPQGYQQVPPQGYQQVPPQGYQQVPPQGYQQVPPQGYQQVPPQGYQQVHPQGYQQVPQQIPQGNMPVQQNPQQQVGQVPQHQQPIPQKSFTPPPNNKVDESPNSAHENTQHQQGGGVPSGGAPQYAVPNPGVPHNAVPNSGIPQNAVPQVNQHLDAPHHAGAPPNVVGQQPPQNIQGNH